MLGVAPALLVLGEYQRGRLAKCGYAQLFPSLEYGIDSGFNLRADGGGLFARLRQRDFLCAAKANVAPLAIFLDPADPGPCTGWADQQIKAVAVTIATRQLGRLDCRSAQPAHPFAPTSATTLDAGYRATASNRLQQELAKYRRI